MPKPLIFHRWSCKIIYPWIPVYDREEISTNITIIKQQSKSEPRLTETYFLDAHNCCYFSHLRVQVCYISQLGSLIYGEDRETKLRVICPQSF